MNRKLLPPALYRISTCSKYVSIICWHSVDQSDWFHAMVTSVLPIQMTKNVLLVTHGAYAGGGTRFEVNSVT